MKKTIYAVIDTNGIVASLLARNSDSATVRVMQALGDGAFCALYNDEIIAEYREVLGRDKFKFEDDVASGVVSMVLDNGLYRNGTATADNVIDPKDAVFYEVALSKEGAYLVTGNTRHFPAQPIVVTPAEMVAILEEMGLISKL
ncbi:MAG: PIN domain-containing protein [Bacteroidales bacterium]|nr:PIN domain-containing protein [Bacteroidales bacterium]